MNFLAVEPLTARQVPTSSEIPGWEWAQSNRPHFAKATATVSKGVSALWLATSGHRKPHHRTLCPGGGVTLR